LTGHDLVISGFSAGYGNRPIVRDVSAKPLRIGEITALVGPNGAGKSTLLRALAGLIRATGTARLGDCDLIALSARERARRVAFMPQSLPAGVGLTVVETLISALKASPTHSGILPRGMPHQAFGVLDRLGIAHLMMEPMDRLSGGQRQLVALAQALVREPRLLLLDEPTSALDLRHQFEVMRTVRSLAEDGRIVVIVLHDLSLAARWADRVIVMADGRLRSEGAPKDAITPAVLADVYKVDARVAAGADGTLQITVDGSLAVAIEEEG